MPDLLASYFTIAGDHPPSQATGVSPHPLKDRIEAAARAGYRGFGFYASDLAAALERLTWADIRVLLADNGIRHVEVECLRNWFADGEARAASDAERALLLDAAGELGAFQMKIGGGLPGRRLIPAIARLFWLFGPPLACLRACRPKTGISPLLPI